MVVTSRSIMLVALVYGLTFCVLMTSAKKEGPAATHCRRGLTKSDAPNRRLGTTGFGAAVAPRDSNCSTCSNSETCCYNQSCCSGGAFCCEQGNICCNDTCCNGANEECCQDPINGGVCCESETSYCCKPQPRFDLPSRCCPRWYVCCDYGKYGCCDPDTGIPMGDEEDAIKNDPRHPKDPRRQRSATTTATKAYALFLEPTWIGNMQFKAATINVDSGARSEVLVDGFHTGGETQRTFMFNRRQGRFLLLQANFTDHSLPNGDLPIHLFTIHPVTGKASAVPVTGGAYNEVTGYRLLPPNERTIVFSTFWFEPAAPSTPSPDSDSSAESQSSASGTSGRARVGYIFYRLDVDTAVATEVSRLRNPAGKDTYAGWFHDVSPDGSIAYRVGFEDVATSANFGITATNISAPNATMRYRLVPRPDGTHGHYRSANLLSSGQPASAIGADPFDVTFVSLAPSYNLSRTGDLSLYRWTPKNAFNATKLGTFPNAHTNPVFGPISEALSSDGNTYVATFIAVSPFGKDSDTQAVGKIVGVRGGAMTATVTQQNLQPQMVAVTVSPAGIGLPDV